MQKQHFAVVEIYFLIVGHTHTSIDQYFSVVGRVIWSCHWLASLLSLEYKLRNESFEISMSGRSWEINENQERKLKSKPLLVRKISVFYDMKKALKPLINNKLVYYSIPHQFRFELFQGVCAMQYKLFSSQRDLLPLRPNVCTGEILYSIISLFWLCNLFIMSCPTVQLYRFCIATIP